MPRPKKPRFVSEYPMLTSFIPEGVPPSGEVFLSIEELEAIRLSDVERHDQGSAADLMQVSRQTYGRILARARGVIGEALVKGRALRIEGGTYEMCGRRQRRRRRRMTGAGAAITEKFPAKAGDTMPQRDGRWPRGKRPGGGSGRGRCYAARTAPVFDGQDRTGSGSGAGRGRGPGKGHGFGNVGGKRR